jgi:Zn-dependent peptidase ImmA (M78 family)
MDERLLHRSLISAQELAHLYGSQRPPYSLLELLERFGIHSVRERLLDRNARLVLQDGCPIIEVNPLFPRARRRFSIAHEIGHIIVNESAGRHRFHISHGCPTEEAYCDRVAEALLAPGEALRRFITESKGSRRSMNRICCSAIFDAARVFGLPVDVMVRRVFQDLGLAPSQIAMIWRREIVENSESLNRSLRVRSVFHSRGRRYAVPPDKTNSSPAVVARAFRARRTLRGEEALRLGSLKGHFRVEAAAYSPSRIWDDFGARSVLSILS